MQGKKQRLEDLFDSRKHPTSNIIYCDGTKDISVCFKELQEHVCFIEDFLRHSQVRGTVCVLTEQGLALPAIILGILKVDSTFAFLDALKPFESLSGYQKYDQIKTLIVQERYLKDLESQLCSCWKKTDQFNLFSKYNLLQSSYCSNNACPNSKEYATCERQSEIAYIVQTSGTTGDPKSVKVPHSCIVPNFLDLRRRFSITTNDVILQLTLITFDPSIVEIFLSLSTGATLIMIPDHIRSISENVLEVVIHNKITVLQCTPSLVWSFGMKALREDLLSKESVLRVLALGSEVCPSFSKLQTWKGDGNCTELYNLYGQTEVSSWASCFKIDFQNGKSLPSIPIGEPLLNTIFEIRDKDGEIADEGELYIGGPGRFCIVNNEEWPINPDSFLRPTGDLVHKASNGFIYFDGRSDGIVRHQSHSISLQLIKSIVDSFPEVENSFIHYDPTTAKLYIFIVLVSAGSLDSDVAIKMVKRLRKSYDFGLPPAFFSPVPFIPMTERGKADKEKLISLLDVNEQRTSFGSDKTEGVISDIWKNYTNQMSVGEHDKFVLYGGDSLTA